MQPIPLLDLSMKEFLARLGIDKIDEYIFYKEIQGGKASTTLIYKDNEENPVVVKMLIAPRHEKELFFFKHEAEVLKELNKINAFVPKLIKDFSQLENYPVYYFVIEYIEGCSLANFIRKRGMLEWPEALNLIQRIAIALSSGLIRHIIHRDLHPGNILITDKAIFDYNNVTYQNPGIIILDYGCAKDILKMMFGRWSEDPFRLMGAVSSWSPESIFAPDHVDSRHDTWALGVMLFYLLTNKYPFPFYYIWTIRLLKII